MNSDLPAAAITAGVAAEAKFYDDDEDIRHPLSQVGEHLVRRILEAAAPVIRADERERLLGGEDPAASVYRLGIRDGATYKWLSPAPSHSRRAELPLATGAAT
jgi:hypothetical protein